jgi:hypothetical protein
VLADDGLLVQDSDCLALYRPLPGTSPAAQAAPPDCSEQQSLSIEKGRWIKRLSSFFAGGDTCDKRAAPGGNESGIVQIETVGGLHLRLSDGGCKGTPDKAGEDAGEERSTHR